MAEGQQEDQLPAFRVVRTFGAGISTSESRAYRVETAGLLTEKEAMALMRRLGSPYQGLKYDEDPLRTRLDPVP